MHVGHSSVYVLGFRGARFGGSKDSQRVYDSLLISFSYDRIVGISVVVGISIGTFEFPAKR